MLTVIVVAAVLVVGGGAAWWARRRFALVTVSGTSMVPTLRPGDRVVVRRVPVEALRAGDVVVLERPDPTGRWVAPPTRRPGARRWMVKRTAAVAGEPVPAVVRLPGPVVPAGHLVVLGDNPPDSLDSRGFGYVPAERVLGRVVRRLPAS
jgi:signal peptidase I